MAHRHIGRRDAAAGRWCRILAEALKKYPPVAPTEAPTLARIDSGSVGRLVLIPSNDRLPPLKEHTYTCNWQI